MWLGGSPNQDGRTGWAWKDKMKQGDLEATLEPVLTYWRDARAPGEAFGDFTNRVVRPAPPPTRPAPPRPDPPTAGFSSPAPPCAAPPCSAPPRLLLIVRTPLACPRPPRPSIPAESSPGCAAAVSPPDATRAPA